MRIRRTHLHWFWETRGEFWHFTTCDRMTFHKGEGGIYRYVAGNLRRRYYCGFWFRGEVKPFPPAVLERLRRLGRLPVIN